MPIKVIEILEMLCIIYIMYNSDSITQHLWNVEVKIAEILKAKAKRNPNFNDKELDVNPNGSQTQNPNLDHHQILRQNHHATVVLTIWVSTGGWSGLRKKEWLRRGPRDSSRNSSCGP